MKSLEEKKFPPKILGGKNLSSEVRLVSSGRKNEIFHFESYSWDRLVNYKINIVPQN